MSTWLTKSGRSRRLVAVAALGILALAACTLISCDALGLDDGPGTAGDAVPGTIRASDLPPEARETLGLIDSGGPFPFRKDGDVFHNYEGLLPAEKDGYYREYTVVTPGSPDRGARRIVTGRDGERYYTDDHYDSFLLVVE